MVYFKIVKLRITNMFFQIIRREEYNNGVVQSKIECVVCQYEILDGIPSNGTEIPFRIYLGGMKIWPLITGKFASLKVDYEIRFVVVDEDSHSYYKSLSDNVFRFE